MKGTITRCLAELVESRWGAERWAEVVRDAGAEREANLRLPSSDVDDALALRLFASTSKVLGLSSRQTADAFGEYWCCTYAPRLYGSTMARFQNARELLLGMDKLHTELTRTIPNARPPRFHYSWSDENTLHVEYRSHRALVEVYCGLARGVGKYFKEQLRVEHRGNLVEIRFLTPG